MIFEFRSLVTCGEGVRHPTTPVCRQSFVLVNHNLRTLVVENELLALAFRALNVLGFDVWFRNGRGLDRCFPSVFGIIAKFPW